VKTSNKLYFLYFIVISQFTIAISPYFYDLIIILFYILLSLKSSDFKLNKYLLISLGIFVSFSILHEIRYYGNDFAIFPKSLYSDLRPFLFLALLYDLLKNLDVKYNFILNILLLNVSINFIFNLIGYINSDLYRKLVTLIFNDSYIIIQYSENNGFPTSLAYMSSLQNRFCGAYIQPISAGLSSSFVILIIIFLLRNQKYNSKVFLILIFSIFNGLVSYSTMFHLLPLFLLIWFIISKVNVYILLSIIFLFITLIIFTLPFIDINEFSLLFFTLTSGRYSTDGNIAGVLLTKNFNFIDILFGFDPYSIGHEGKGVGDSGFFIKWISGGIIYIFLYFIMLYKNITYFIKKLSTNENIYFNHFFNFIFFIFLLVELGTTPFSLPQFSIFFYLVFLLVLKLCSSHESKLVLKKFI